MTKCRPRAPVRCRAWEASSGRCSAIAAPKWMRRSDGPRPEDLARGRSRAPGRGDDARAETPSLSGMVIEREREIRDLSERLREANECHDRSIASLDAVTARLEEIQAQARGQATRIRMKALREAVEVSRRVAGADRGRGRPAGRAGRRRAAPATGPRSPTASSRARSSSRSARWAISPSWSASRTRSASSAPPRSRSSASPRAARPSRCGSTSRSSCCASSRSLSALDFKVRHTAPDNLILDVDEDPGPEQRAA